MNTGSAKGDRPQKLGTPVPKVATRIRGIDEILHGGLPKGRATVVSGGPGSGKTIMGLEFLYRAALAGEPGIFISFEEPAEAIRRNALALGWDFEALEREGKLALLDGRIDPAAIHSGEFDINGLLAILGGQAESMGARNVVIDAIDGLLHLLDNPRLEREQLEILHRWLLERGLTAMLTVKDMDGDAHRGGLYRFLDYMVDCIIKMDQRVTGQISTRRLRVVKYRGSGFERNEFPFVITSSGIRTVPISRAVEWAYPAPEALPTGVDAFDDALGGGLLNSSITLISGSSGTGKTSLAATIALAAAGRGQRVLYVQFEEPAEAMVSRLLSPGIDLKPAIDSGLLSLINVMPETAGTEEHLIHLLELLEEHDPAMLVVDAISATTRISTPEAAYDFMVRLTNACRELGVTCVFTYQSGSESSADSIAGMDISSLIDAVILLNYAEEDDVLHRTLLVLKSRGMAHSNRRHRLYITSDGLELDGGGTTLSGKRGNG